MFFGSYWIGAFPPEAYGIKTGPTDYTDVLNGVKPGLYAVSPHIISRARNTPGGGWWLRQTRPVAIVGHVFYIYRIP